MINYDYVIIGSGAGLMVLESALSSGYNCAIVENSKFGGTCLTKGCIPSKMLVYPADLIREAREGKKIGLDFAQPSVDWGKISSRMWAQIGHSEAIEKFLDGADGLSVYKGTGEFTGENTMRVKYKDGSYSAEFSADNFIIAAGAHSFVPAIDGLEDAGYLVSETFFGDKYPSKPWKSLIIVGVGPIGCEFANIFSAFGTKITLLQAGDRILKAEDEEISAFVASQFEHNNIEVITNVKILSAGTNETGKTLTIEDGSGNRRVIEGEEIFVSAGIRSNGDSLALDKAGVALDSMGWVITNEYLETSQKNIWALGDINGKYQFRHKANFEAGVLIKNLFGYGEKKKVCYNTVPWAVFTSPQVAHVGLTEEDAKKVGIEYWVGKNYYSQIASGISMGYKKGESDDGFVKLIVGKDKKILGVHIVGPNAAILLQPFVYLMNAGLTCTKSEAENSVKINELRVMCPPLGTYTPINDSMVIHPSFSELTAWALDNINRN